MSSLRVFIDEYHDFGHVIQASCQRERTDTTRQQRTIIDLAGRQQVRLQVLGDSCSRKRWHLQFIDGLHIRQQTTADCWHSLVGERNLSTESLSFGSQIHDGTSCCTGILPDKRHHSLIVDTSITDGLSHCPTIQLYSRVGHHWHSCHLFLTDDISHPLLHVHLHRYKIFTF